MAKTIDQPVEDYGADDIFMSRTDKSGTIITGNTTFIRLSGYPLVELIGKPHKIIRHPDMPRGAFAQMWHWLKQEHPFVGYVKNRAADGRYYWVMAVVVPVEGGYLSVRLKPRTERFEAVRKIYAELLAAEKEQRMSPEEARLAVVDAVKSLGFQNYRHFACDCLILETEAAWAARGEPAPKYHENYEAIATRVMELNDEVKSVVESFDRIEGSPVNLSIQGARLDQGSAAVKVIAQNYGTLSEHLRQSINTVLETLQDLTITAQKGRMYAGANVLYSRAVDSFQAEDWPENAQDKDAELGILREILEQMYTDLRGCIRSIDSEVDKFVDSIAKLRMQASGLALTRVMCNIEASMVQGDTSGLSEITRRLSDFQDKLGHSLDRIQRVNMSLSQELEVVKRDPRRRTPPLAKAS